MVPTELIQLIYRTEYRKFTSCARRMFTLQSTLMVQWLYGHSQKVIVDYLDSPKLRDWDIAVFDFMLEISGIYLSDKWGVLIVFNSVTLSFTPMLLPHWPFPVLGSQFTENMTFTQRLFNSLMFLLVYAVKLSVILRNTVVMGAKQCPPVSKVLYSGAGNGYPLLINSVIGFEFPRSQFAVTHYTGPLLPISISYSSLNVSASIANWLQYKNSNGVIFISMGSTAHLTHSIAKSIIESVQLVNFSAIWSLGASEQNILDGIEFNRTQIFVASWLPQKDVLNHPSVKIAVLHGGLGGIQEALLSKVPIICLPQMFDQWDNAVRIEFHHLGMMINPHSLTRDKMVNAINSILQHYSAYERSIVKTCRLFKLAGGLQRTSELVELYLDVGHTNLGNQLHTHTVLELLSVSSKQIIFTLVCIIVMIYVLRM